MKELKGFVLQGAVDNYFPLMKFLQWSANNEAMTTTTLFDYPLETYRLPSTVRTDKKGESTLIHRSKDRIWRRSWNLYCGIFIS